MLKDGLYNKAVMWNDEIDNAIINTYSYRWSTRPTNHYYQRAKELHLPFGVYKAALKGEVIECEIFQNRVIKVVSRFANRMSERHEDICIVMSFHFENQIATAKTVWVNQDNDHHATINKSNYIGG